MVLVLVPIAIAVIGVLPSFRGGSVESTSSPIFDLKGAEFRDTVTMVDTQNILNEIHQGPDKLEIEAAIQRATKLASEGLSQEAIEIFKSLAEQTQSPGMFNNLGALYATSGQNDQALEAFEEGLSREPDSVPLMTNLALLYHSQGETDEALAVLENAPENSTAAILREDLASNKEESVMETDHEVTAHKSNSKTAPGGPVSSFIVGTKEQEPNNTIFEANIIKLGQDVEAETAAPDDHDYFKFKFDTRPRDKVTVRFESRSTSIRPNIIVYDGNKSQILHHSNGTYGSILEFTLSMNLDADYYLQVHPYDGSGSYVLSVVPQNAFDRFEPNGDSFSATPIQVGNPIEANIMDSMDSDWYRFTAGDSETIAVRFESRSMTVRPNIKVFDRNKSQILHHSNGTYGSILEFEFNAEAGSEYFLQVLYYDGEGDYQLLAR
jgi:tetratricopeptide (TPR) repeat protein